MTTKREKIAWDLLGLLLRYGPLSDTVEEIAVRIGCTRGELNTVLHWMRTPHVAQRLGFMVPYVSPGAGQRHWCVIDAADNVTPTEQRVSTASANHRTELLASSCLRLKGQVDFTSRQMDKRGKGYKKMLSASRMLDGAAAMLEDAVS